MGYLKSIEFSWVTFQMFARVGSLKTTGLSYRIESTKVSYPKSTGVVYLRAKRVGYLKPTDVGYLRAKVYGRGLP